MRVATLGDSNLVALRLGELEMINCASPGYLRQYGSPTSVADLDSHLLLHYSATLGADLPELEYQAGGHTHVRRMKAIVTVNSADAFTAACRAGLGIIQVPRAGVAQWLESGELVEVLPNHRGAPLPVFLLHPHGQSVPKRVRVVLDWLASILRAHLQLFSTKPRASRPTSKSASSPRKRR